MRWRGPVVLVVSAIRRACLCRGGVGCRGGAVGRICGLRTVILAEDVRVLQIAGIPSAVVWRRSQSSCRKYVPDSVRFGLGVAIA